MQSLKAKTRAKVDLVRLDKGLITLTNSKKKMKRYTKGNVTNKKIEYVVLQQLEKILNPFLIEKREILAKLFATTTRRRAISVRIILSVKS